MTEQTEHRDDGAVRVLVSEHGAVPLERPRDASAIHCERPAASGTGSVRMPAAPSSHRLHVRRRWLAIPLLGAVATLPGCVVWEIRDELVSVNTRLAAVDERLGSIDEQLQAIEPQLEPLPNLERLQTLGSITTSLEQIDAHLAALRRTISSLDRAVPFLKFSSEEDSEAEPAPDAPDAPDAPETENGRG
jgi:hypothetical protein